jgi:hypothetical protein
MAEQMRCGDSDGADTWLRIIVAIGELGSRRPRRATANGRQGVKANGRTPDRGGLTGQRGRRRGRILVIQHRPSDGVSKASKYLNDKAFFLV